MSITNQIYVKIGYQLNQTFQNVATQKFDSGVKSLNFTDADGSAQTINKFVEEKTNNKIMDVVSSDMFDSTTRTVLVNAVYFKGKWQRAFDPKKTTQGQFQFNSGGSGPINYMTTVDTFNYGDLNNLNAKALEMPYASSNLSFFIILPNDQRGLGALQDKLNVIDWTIIINQMTSQKVNATIPKFKSYLQLSLNKILSNVRISIEFFFLSASLIKLWWFRF